MNAALTTYKCAQKFHFKFHRNVLFVALKSQKYQFTLCNFFYSILSDIYPKMNSKTQMYITTTTFYSILSHKKMPAHTQANARTQAHTTHSKKVDLFICALSLHVKFCSADIRDSRDISASEQRVTCQACRTGRAEKKRWINRFKVPCNLPGAAITCFYGNQAGQFCIFHRRMRGWGNLRLPTSSLFL